MLILGEAGEGCMGTLILATTCKSKIISEQEVK